MLLYSLLEYLDIKSCILFLFVFLLIIDIMTNNNLKNFPPGPKPFPLLGNVFTAVDISEIDKLAEKYGPVFSLWRGRENTVFVSGYKMVKEALVNQGENFADRPVVPLFDKVYQGLGLALTNGYQWKKHRRFALTTLKNFGMGKNTLESFILEENRFLYKAFKEEHGRPFDPHFLLNSAISNVICSMVFGHRFEYNDPRFQDILRRTDETFLLIGSLRAQLYNVCPSIMKFLPGPHQTVFSNYKKVKAFLKEEIENHRKNWDPSNSRDFIDTYFEEMEKKKDDIPAGFHETNLVICTLDLLEAGTETSATTLRWSLLYMVKYPEIQKKVQAEIDRVIGKERQPSMADRVHLPYTDAVIHEVQRMGNIVPLNVPRMTTKDTTLGGYFISKGTAVITNISSVLFDKNEWETPDTFNPKHFLDSYGKFRKRDAFLPFSAGKRVCLGEQLARMELFLFFTSFLQNFTFKAPEGEDPSVKFQLGGILTPRPFKICAIPR
uniref:Cytochrome P450, family 2, subfamily N, polypeptide 13 n=1 Tax=Lepisosteus oculatus TaxID=7918 RepID=W5MRC1_LEPOC